MLGKLEKINNILPNIILFLIILFILFIFLDGCKSLSPEDLTEENDEETTKEPVEKITNENENMEYHVITESEYFEMPDEIILYNKGKQIIIGKNTETYKKIVYITNERFKKDCGMAEEVIPDEFVEEIKNKFAIEFIYNKKTQTIYTCCESRYEKYYTKILFPLPDCRAIFGPYEFENQNEYYQKYQNGPLCVSVQPESDQLIEIIEEELISR